MRITEELLEWKSSGSGSRKPTLTAVGKRCAHHATPSIRKSMTLISPTSCGRSVGIVRLRTKATNLVFLVICRTSWFPGVARVYRGLSSWTLLKLSVAFYNLRYQLLPSIYPLLRNRCLAINNSSLLVSADMNHVPFAWQRPGWNIHISSDISVLWAECHISPCLYSSLYLYNQVKEGNETIPFTER
jgi:hypothetical protein